MRLLKPWTSRCSESDLSPEQKELRQLKTVRPIKAALSSATSSPFDDPVISKFIDMMMQDGHKVLARGIMTQTLETIKTQALENCKPIIGLASIQKGRKFYQVPVPLTDNRKRFLAMKWMITECRDNKHRRTHMYEKLSQELLAAFSNEGNVVKRKHDLHKMAEANRAYAHYRWW
ncbi:28S ribosomal protein S7 [Triplophysa rosa]|uniref:28S ribosomal protein S7 n=1 Tax=Triplophysa rosa TaxID=992332 RepID=A0A9W7WM63_TRIRA|nr:28S ribosomal protein S7 [Triplophysa rosa]